MDEEVRNNDQNCRPRLVLVDVERSEQGSEAEMGSAQVAAGSVVVSTSRQ